MSELRRGWWKGGRKVRTDSKGKYVKVRMEEAQHIRDAFEFVDQCGCRTMAAAELLNRGTPPEPEWLPVGVAPDREGRWERMRGTRRQLLYVAGREHGLWASFDLGAEAPVEWLNHDGIRYRRIGDL